jgi:DNA-binding NarL/FixJ family response regulator
MSVRIAVSDPLPVYRRGMLATLGNGGFEAETPEDLLSWARQEDRRVVFLTLQGSRDWFLLAQLRQAGTDVIVVAVLADSRVQTHVRAILAGAAVAVPRDASPAIVRRIFEEVVSGTSMVPTDVVRALVMSQERQITESPLPEAELKWLRGLARGITVAQLAEQNGYSERAMFRLLRALYDRMGVRGRTEALMMANRRGWL